MDSLRHDISKGNPRYTVFDHTADMGLEIYGSDEKELFVNAAFALFDSMTDMGRVKKTVIHSFNVEGVDREDLLVNFLRDMLALYNGEGLLVKEVTVDFFTGRRLAGTVAGEHFDSSIHRIKMEIKAVTYHMLLVEETSRGWRGRVICDV
jgi:SHS2 domain-containing protein